MKLVHISDVHVGDSPRALLETAATAINALEPAVVVLSGDLTQSGSRREYVEAAWFLSLFSCPVVGAPGNHDAPVHNVVERLFQPYARFDALGVGKIWRHADPAVEIIALNTSRPIQARLDWSQGVYPEGAFVDDDTVRGEAWRIVAAHHPPISFEGAHVRSDARRGAAAWMKLGSAARTLLLCGHLHRFTVVPVPPRNGAHLIVAPTLSSSRARRAGLGFVEIDFTGEEASIRLHLHNGAAYAPALEVGPVRKGNI